jgi:hypothetical protein
MTSWNRMTWLAVAAVCLGVCGKAGAGGYANAANTTVQILFDKSYEAGLADKQIEQRNQVVGTMGPDLVRVLQQRGKYKAALIDSRDAFKPAADTYLLVVKITKYNPGSKGARMMVGYGAGAASLDIRYELFGQGKDAILTKDDGVGSSRDWRNCSRKLNENMLAQLDAKFSGAAK